ncbi:hypothetical protein [Paenibacillus alvei]|nr:hypothetical protein [Paenibacillus alvei]
MKKSRNRLELRGLPCGSFWRERMEHDVAISYYSQPILYVRHFLLLVC